MSNRKLTYRELQVRLADAEAIVQALRQGQVDAVVGAEHVALVRLREVEAALRAERNLLRTLIDNMPDLIYVKDAQGRFLAANVAAAGAVGADAPGQLLGKTAFDFYPHELASRTHAAEQMVVLSGHPIIDQEEQEVDQAGEPRWTLHSRVPLRDEQGRVMGIVGIGHDITERKQAEGEQEKLQAQFLQAQKMEAIGRLTAGIAHDFNNLLTAINGFAELVQMQMPPQDPLQKHVTRILGAGKSAADLVRQLMAFSRKQLMEMSVVDLNAALSEMPSMLQRMIGEDIVLETHLADDLWPVKVDPAQLRQVVVNLAVNARDAMPGGGRLTLATANAALDEGYAAAHPGVRPGDYVMLAISDTGCGMSLEVQAHLFEPFFTTKERGKGTGLGLATAYGIVKQTGGAIHVYSELGVGTTFRIYLPPTQEAAGPPPPTRSEADVVSSAATILLVEDQPEARESVAAMLKLQGHRVIEATCAEEALRLSQEWADPIHLLLTDVVMPGVGGKGLAAQLIPQRPGMRVLYMSGYADDVIVHRGHLEAGAAFLQKPFTSLDLARKVQQLLHGSSPPGPEERQHTADVGQCNSVDGGGVAAR